MTRYLDRAPRKGDLVEVPASRAIYARPSSPSDYPHGWDRRFPHRVTVDGVEGWASAVRVIAPEPKVGDVVTNDMDLPEGSIIETSVKTGSIGGLVKKTADGWRGHFNTYSTPRFDRGSWRIVRIGGAS